MNKKKKLYSIILLGAALLSSCGKSSSIDSNPTTPSITGGDNSNSSVDRYLVSFNEVIDCSIQLDHSDNKYKEGELVSIVLGISNESKEFDRFECDDVSIEINSSTSNRIEAFFIMPEKNVVIDVILKDKDLDSFRIKELKNYSTYDASLKEGDKFKAGDSVELILSGSYFSSSDESNTYIQIDDEYYHPSLVDSINGSATSMSLSFVMPNKDISIIISTGNNQISNKGFKVSLDENEYVDLIAYNPEEKYTRFYGGLVRKIGYKVTSVQYKIGTDGQWNDNYSLFDISNICNLYILNITADVEIKVIGEFTGVRTITYINEDAIIPTTSSLYYEGTEGDTYSVSFKPHPKYTLTGKPTFEGVEVNDDDVTETYFKLTIGLSDITITFPAKINNKITVLDNHDLDSYIIKKDNIETDCCASLATFNFYPTMKRGKVITAARTIDSNGTKGSWCYPSDDSYGVQSIEMRMPKSGDCQIEINTADGFTIDIDKIDHGSMTINRDTFRKDDRVYFTIQTESNFYRFNKLIDSETGETIETTMNENSGYFTMPEKSLKLKPIIVEVEKADVNLIGDLDKLESIEIQGNKSLTRMNKDKILGTFIVGEYITILPVTLKSQYQDDYIVTVKKRVNGNEEEIKSSYGSYSFSVEKGLTDIVVSVEEKAQVKSFKATINKPDGVKLTFRVNYQSVTSLDDTLIPGADGKARLEIFVNGNAKPSDYNVQVLDNENKEVVAVSGMISVAYMIYSDITINITAK